MRQETLISMNKPSGCLLKMRHSTGLSYKTYFICFECAWRSDKSECDRLRAT